MSVTHHGRPVSPVRDGRPVSAPARRVSRRRWQDPRLWLGIALVAVSVVVGARLLAAADETVPVWRLTQPLQPGDPVTAEAVEVAHVHFGESGHAAAYLSAEHSLVDGLRAERVLHAGELLPADAVSSDDVAVPRQLPLGVSAAGIPTGLAAGDRVDVWAVPEATGRAAASSLVLAEVTVVALSQAGPSGIATERQVLVTVADEVDLGAALDRLNGASVVLVRVGD
ncbi:MAG: hypothetical protein ACRDO2_11780 [Nocardioidaceae bacterium]